MSKDKLLFTKYPFSGVQKRDYGKWLAPFLQSMTSCISYPAQVARINTPQTRDWSLKQQMCCSWLHRPVAQGKESVEPMSGVEMAVVYGIKKAKELSGVLSGRHQCHLLLMT